MKYSEIAARFCFSKFAFCVLVFAPSSCSSFLYSFCRWLHFIVSFSSGQLRCLSISIAIAICNNTQATASSQFPAESIYWAALGSCRLFVCQSVCPCQQFSSAFLLFLPELCWCCFCASLYFIISSLDGCHARNPQPATRKHSAGN